MKKNKTSIGGAEFHALGQDTNKEEKELRECVEYCRQQNGMQSGVPLLVKNYAIYKTTKTLE